MKAKDDVNLRTIYVMDDVVKMSGNLSADEQDVRMDHPFEASGGPIWVTREEGLDKREKTNVQRWMPNHLWCRTVHCMCPRMRCFSVML